MNEFSWATFAMAGLALLGQIMQQRQSRLVAKDKMEFDEKMGALKQQNLGQQSELDKLKTDLNGVGAKYSEIVKHNLELAVKHDSCERRCLVLETKIEVLETDRSQQAKTIQELYAKVHNPPPPTVVVVAPEVPSPTEAVPTKPKDLLRP